MTNYIVLVQDAPTGAPSEVINGSSGPWKVAMAGVEAVSAEAAVRKAVDDKGGTYVAVPMRSWAPVTVKIETTRKLTLA